VIGSLERWPLFLSLTTVGFHWTYYVLHCYYLNSDEVIVQRPNVCTNSIKPLAKRMERLAISN
jgi:hypothetical protein